MLSFSPSMAVAPKTPPTERAPRRAPDGFYHPTTEGELRALVLLARERDCSLRVRGSGHSIAQAIYTDAYLAARPLAIDVMLDQYTRVAFDDARRRVTVQAGCHLGVDPRDPTGTSTWETSLLAQLDARGWALPDLGGVSHQTIAGFLMTGSSGGSLQYAIEEAVLAFRFIDGRGDVHEAMRGEGELFDGFACSLGLLGVVSTVTLQCIPRYDIQGSERICEVSAAPFDLFGEDFAQMLRATEYARLIWWPQRGFERLATWQAARMRPTDYGVETGPLGALREKPYRVLGELPLSPDWQDRVSNLAQHIAGSGYSLMDALEQVRDAVASALPVTKPLGERAEALLAKHLLPVFLRMFAALDDGDPQRFWDSWHHGLPMDNQMSEDALPTTFTEIWVPMDRATEVMRALRDHFEQGGLAATGTYAFEMYAARATRGWLHPGHGRDSLRIDVFWRQKCPKDCAQFFSQFWDLLAPFGYRLHWGKHLPDDAARGADYLRAQYPRWDDFLALRERLDPQGIFLNRHLKKALGVAAEPASYLAREREIFVTSQPTQERRHAPMKGSLPERIQAFYRSFPVERERSLERLSELFSEDVYYRDSFHETQGIAPFRVLFERMFAQYKGVDFEEFQLHGGEEHFTLTYVMRMRMIVGPWFSVPMASVFTARDGRVVELLDYYDMGTALTSPIAPVARAYRWVISTFFL
jgi:FAD/FMN-containing dehydrogenase/limonene-1,2-epoxide hydrolase